MKLDGVTSSTFGSILTDGLLLGVIVIDGNYHILLWNQWMEKNTGIREGGILGQNLFEMYPDIGDRNKDKYIIDCVENRKPVFLSPLFHDYLIPIEIVKAGDTIQMLQNVKIYPAFDEEDTQGAIIIIEDFTEQIHHEEEISRLNRILRATRDVNQLITRVKSEDELLTEACKILVEGISYEFAWVGFTEEGSFDVKPAAYAELEVNIFPDMKITWDDSEYGRGTTGTAIKTGKTQIIGQVTKEPRGKPWRDLANRFGIQSACSLPLKVYDNVIGALTVYSREHNIFHGEELRLLEEVTGDISFGIQALWERQKRQQAEEELKEYSERLEEMVEERTKELRDAQERLVRQERLAVLGQLAGSVAHELRNPLGGIRNAAYFLNMAIEEPAPEVKEALEIMEKEVGTSDRIITSLFDFTRPKPLNPLEININDIVNEALSRITMPENVEVVRKLDEALPTVLADADQLGQVFGNLIENAIQSMTLPRPAGTAEGGQLVIRSKVASPEWIAVSFTDTGVGISEGNRSKVFEPLFTTKAKGIGLGLALSKLLVERHEGTIELESEEGKGTTFTVKLLVE